MSEAPDLREQEDCPSAEACDGRCDQHERDHFTLPEQRVRLRVQFGGISRTHVVIYDTFPAARHPGRWTRRACDRRTLCGSLRACVVGIDAADWQVDKQQALDISRVDCQRCRDRYERIAPALDPDPTPTTETRESAGESES